MSQLRKSLAVCVWMVIALAAAGCPSDDEGAGGQGDADGGTSDEPGGSGSGGDGSGGRGTGDDAGMTDTGSGSGEAGTGEGGAGGGDEPSAGNGGASGGEAGRGGAGGRPGSDTPELDTFCTELRSWIDDNLAANHCSGDSSSEAALCAVAGDCIAEGQEMLDCLDAQPAENWSCAGDGQATLGDHHDCDATRTAYLTCIGASIKETDPWGCGAFAEEHAATSDALGCTVDDGITDGCNNLYVRARCTAEWEAVIECVDFTSTDNVECAGAENHLHPKADVCVDEQTAFDDCTATL